MNVILKFDYYIKTIYIPDGYINNLNKVYLDFFGWLENQAECLALENGAYGLSYDESHFVKYINEELLGDCSEKAYILRDTTNRKNIPILKF